MMSPILRLNKFAVIAMLMAAVVFPLLIAKAFLINTSFWEASEDSKARVSKSVIHSTGVSAGPL
ncbi:MAG: hypothetical protein EOP41_05320 [Sphingobacteriaceae bacterium]|nr:MAG: hypothetical protein EOP41_05320 [Sphingobacteriaceae bacterium]